MFRDLALPACFTDFRAALEKLHGAMAGARRYVRVLQLLGEHPLTRVRKAIDACTSEHLTSAEAVIQRTRSFATIEATTAHGIAAAARNARRGSGPGAAPRPELLRPVPGRPENHKSSTDEIMPMQCSDPSAEGPVAVFFA